MDCTLGPGGMAARILKVCAPTGRLIAIDRDPQAIERAKEALRPYIASVWFHCGNFQDLASILDTAGCSQVDGVLFDLGIELLTICPRKLSMPPSDRSRGADSGAQNESSVSQI